MPIDDRQALGSIDHFIAVATRMAKLPMLRQPEFRPAAEGLREIARKLMDSNENMARWLNAFLQFDFRQTGASGPFRTLVGDYRTAKAGAGFHEMKFRCGDIYTIYHDKIESQMPAMFAEDQAARLSAQRAFDELSNADDDLVAFIYDTVVGGIDHFVNSAEDGLDKGDINAAETARLEFNVDSRHLSAQLVAFAGALAELVLTFSRLTRGPVTSN